MKSSRPARRLARPRHGRVIAGVCAGLGNRFGISIGLIRLLFVLSVILPGTQVIFYIILWILMPSEDSRAPRAAKRDSRR